MSFSFRFVAPLATAALAATGVAILAEGCGPGDTRYYCDSSGCYNCDGYGCHSVAPPSNTECTGNSQCAQNQICTSEGCTTVCKADTDCPQGDVCKSGLCVAPTSTTNPAPVVCTKDSDCGANQECVGTGAFAKCEDKSNVCQYSSQCGAGKDCANGECLTDCSQGETCPTGTTCEQGVCEPSSNQCTSDAQCSGSTPKCEQGQCVAACDPNANPSTCSSGYVCENGACVIDTQPTPNCGNGGAQCLATQECLDGFCRYTCNTPNGQISQPCELIDNRIGYCAKDGTCRDAAEAQAQCLEASDCASGQSCISNTCQ